MVLLLSGSSGHVRFEALVRKRILTDPDIKEVKERREAQHTPWRVYSDGSDYVNLCCECKGIDWACVARLANMLPERRHLKIRSFGDAHQELARSSCKICRILSYTISPTWKAKQYDIMAQRTTTTLLQDPAPPAAPGLLKYLKSSTTLSQCTLLFAQEPGPYPPWSDGPCVAVLEESERNLDVAPRRLAPNHINYGIFRDLIKRCRRKHKQCRHATSVDNVAGLRVIDIRQKKVISAPRRCRYFALSYVWGSPETCPRGDLTSPLLVIEDAMAVTAALGCKYLWVDRYCINQESPEKHQMLKQMDRIYANAFLTIIAASGKDANAGLPGVSKVQRPLQQETRVPNNVMLLHMPNGYWALKNSTWATRGWTYQEGYFSKRRLIFTDEQVLFMCNEMYLPESLRCSYGPFSAGLEWPIPREFHSLIPNDDKSESALLEQIEEYSRRGVTYRGDALNAFLGVLNHYNSISSRTGDVRKSHVHGILVNQSTESLNLHLLWHHQHGAERQRDFPSWSWAGWKGAISFSNREGIQLGPTCRAGQFDSPCREILVEEQGQVKTTMAKFVRDRLAGLHESIPPSLEPRRLWISCSAVPSELRDIELPERYMYKNSALRLASSMSHHVSSSGRLVVLPLCDNTKVGVRAYFDRHVEQLDGKDMMSLLLVRTCSADVASFQFLMVERVGEDEYERIGTVHLEFRSWSSSGMVFLDSEGHPWRDWQVDLRPLSFKDLFKDGYEERTICLV